MEDIDELRRALEAANMRAAAAEAVAGQAEARVAEVEDELRRLQAQRQAERGINPNQPKPKPSDGSLTAYGHQLARMDAVERELIRRLMTDYPSPHVVMDEYISFVDPPRPTSGRLSRRGGGGPRRVTLHHQASNGSVMLRAETGNFDMAADSSEYICLQIDRHTPPNKAMTLIVNFVQELDRVKRVSRPTQAVKDIDNALSRVRNGGRDYTVAIE